MTQKLYLKFITPIIAISLVVLFSITAFAEPFAMIAVEDVSETVFESIESSADADKLQPKGTLLSEDSQTSEDIYEYLANELRNMSEKIDVSSYEFSKKNIREFDDVYESTLRMNADLYYVSFGFKYHYNSKGKITDVTPKYITTDKEEISQTVEQIENKIAEFLSCVNSSMSDLEKILTLYERVILYGKYDSTLEKDAAKDFFLDGEAICNGYASAMYILAERAGIPSTFVRSVKMDHVWNAFYIDGSWYHADATWDDTSAQSPSLANHKYFLKSNEWMLTTGKHYDFTELENDSTKYDDAFWNDAESPITALAGHMFYIDEASNCYANISVLNSHTGETSQIYKFENLWYTSSDKSGYWGGTFSGLTYINGRLYVNNETQVLSFKLDGSDVRIEYTLENPDEYSIYGCHKINEEFCITVGLKSNPISNLKTQAIELREYPFDSFHVVSIFENNQKTYLSYINCSKMPCNIVVFNNDKNGFEWIETIEINNTEGTVEIPVNSENFQITALNDNFVPLMNKIFFNAQENPAA